VKPKSETAVFDTSRVSKRELVRAWWCWKMAENTMTEKKLCCIYLNIATKGPMIHSGVALTYEYWERKDVKPTHRK